MSIVIVLALYIPIFAWHLYKICTNKTQEELDRAAKSAFVGVAVLAVAVSVCLIVEVLLFGFLSISLLVYK